MNVRRESKHERYDAVVIGSGIGGLTAAALLARAGKHVLVVERHDRPGGYAHSFNRKKYLFDCAIRVAGGCAPSDSADLSPIDSVLRVLGVREQCEFLRVDPFYGAVFPGIHFHAPLGVEEFIQAHARLFPAEETRLREFMRLCQSLNRELRRFSVPAFLQAPRSFPNIFRYHRATLSQALDEYLTAGRLKALLATFWPYLGLPPSRLSFLTWCVSLLSFIEEGAFYCRGSFQKLADAFVTALTAQGGELLLRVRVRRIQVKDGAVSGIVLENGQRIQAPLVVSNADALETFEELVGVGHLPASFLKTLQRMNASLSAFLLFLATDLDLRESVIAHETFAYRSWDHDETYQDILAGKPRGIGITVPTLVDPTLAPPGEHLVTVTTLIPYQIGASWRERKAVFAEELLIEADAFLPGLRNHVIFEEGASPRTLERYTLNLSGAMYGWEPSPGQSLRRLNNETPIRGLYLSGHWTQPGSGVYGVVLSGLQTAKRILGYTDLSSFGQVGNVE